MRKALDTDPYVLPDNLPIPTNDGACQHLRGMMMPSILLQSTSGHAVDVADVSMNSAVFFFYPETGKPGTRIPKGWNEIPGARGCTPQSCSFRDQYREFRQLEFEVFGVSSQSLDEQIEFAKRNDLPYKLLNDAEFKLAKALRLPSFQFESKTFIKRLALVVIGGRIERVFYPVFPPNKNAETVLNDLRGRSYR